MSKQNLFGVVTAVYARMKMSIASRQMHTMSAIMKPPFISNPKQRENNTMKASYPATTRMIEFQIKNRGDHGMIRNC